jgi:hypothetical protein
MRGLREVGRQHLAAGFIETGQPAREQLRRYALHCFVHLERIPLIAAAPQHHRRPEIPDIGDMRRPFVIGDRAGKNRPKLGIGPHPRVE